MHLKCSRQAPNGRCGATVAGDRGTPAAAHPGAGLGPRTGRRGHRGTVRGVLVRDQPAPDHPEDSRVRGRATRRPQPLLPRRPGGPRVTTLRRGRTLAHQPAPPQGPCRGRTDKRGPHVTEPLEVSLHIAARPEIVFGYFTDPTRYTQWMGNQATLDPVPVGTYQVGMREGVAAAGEFVELDPPHPRAGAEGAARAGARRRGSGAAGTWAGTGVPSHGDTFVPNAGPPQQEDLRPMATTRRPTKAEAKRARIEAARTAAARAQRRSRNLRIGLWSAAGIVVLALVVTVSVVLTQPDTPKAAPAPATSAAGRTSNPPWSAPADASAAVAAAGLPMLGEEGSALHIHAHLDVIANGSPVQVPADIGVDDARQKISPLHSHDTTGVIHIESPTKTDTFTLGQFFAEWQVSLAADHIGGLAADATHHLKVYVNGIPRTGDPAGIALAAHDEIAIVYAPTLSRPTCPT